MFHKKICHTFCFSESFEISKALAAAPLPKFSPMVEQHLTSPNSTPERIFNMVTKECALYYLGNWPMIGEQYHYKIIGEKMYRRYPGIALEGAHPWVNIYNLNVCCYWQEVLAYEQHL